jgi:hypothetical protein
MKVLEIKINKNGEITSKTKGKKCKVFERLPVSLRGVGALLLIEEYITEEQLNNALLFETAEQGAKNLYKLITKTLKKDLDSFIK